MKNSLLTKSARRARMRIALLLAALVLVFLLSFSLGRYDVPVGQVVKILISRVFPMEASWTKNMEIAVLNVRLPRILLVCMVGCCLAMAGAGYQSVFQNPMAAPDILGASSGACFGAALGDDHGVRLFLQSAQRGAGLFDWQPHARQQDC